MGIRPREFLENLCEYYTLNGGLHRHLFSLLAGKKNLRRKVAYINNKLVLFFYFILGAKLGLPVRVILLMDEDVMCDVIGSQKKGSLY